MFSRLVSTENSQSSSVPRTPAPNRAHDTAHDLPPRFTEAALRALTATVLGVFAYTAIMGWVAAPHRVTLLLLVVGACLTTGLSLIARTPKRRDWRPVALICSLGGSYGCIAYNLAPGVKVVPEAVGATLQVLGILWQLYAKASLRRSFGILPANRGVVSRGAYCFVRHPMYLGYFVTDLGFLLVNFSLYNMLVHAAQLSLQIGRIRHEERLLSEDERYRAYRDVVRYRLIPFVF
ncbi:methyltransferase family protein [Trinickia mobilis]|uniref:methyltransferase family protein n=1 Tax=Trinickia mobilis TaxID=2816356 RepID=UPI001A8E4FB2|nr:isoprenylcysteine carboxylmethyltransferase family protein [Trinickia mobilis]